MAHEIAQRGAYGILLAAGADKARDQQLQKSAFRPDNRAAYDQVALDRRAGNMPIAIEIGADSKRQR